MRALIVLGGDVPSETLLTEQMDKAQLTIAADSGLDAYLRYGKMPNILLGDMDSVDEAAKAQYEKCGGRMQVYPRMKDDTDGVAALDYAMAAGAKEIILLGALGGRMDHALANCMLLVRGANRGVQVEIVSERERVLLVRGRRSLSGKVGSLLSLLPLGDAKIRTLEGLFYPLQDYEMRCDYPIGVSNVFVEEEAVVEVAQGDVLCFLTEK